MTTAPRSSTRLRAARDEALVATPLALVWIAARRASNGAPVASCEHADGSRCGWLQGHCPADAAMLAALYAARRDEAVEHQDAAELAAQ